MEWILFALIIILVVIRIKEIITKTNRRKKHTEPVVIGNLESYLNHYQKKFILTKNEYHEYKKLKQYADEKNLVICPKIRLLDLIEPRKGERYQTYLNKIQSKHVDFVICDKDLYIKAILELDDNSHAQSDRQERDLFVDTVLKDVGYNVIRTKGITETTLDIIT